MKAKAILYNVVLFLSGSLGLLFSQNWIIKSVCILIGIIFCTIIYFDKEYRSIYIPLVKDWYIISLIIILLIILTYYLVG